MSFSISEAGAVHPHESERTSHVKHVKHCSALKNANLAVSVSYKQNLITAVFSVANVHHTATGLNELPTWFLQLRAPVFSRPIYRNLSAFTGYLTDCDFINRMLHSSFDNT